MLIQYSEISTWVVFRFFIFYFAIFRNLKNSHRVAFGRRLYLKMIKKNRVHLSLGLHRTYRRDHLLPIFYNPTNLAHQKAFCSKSLSKHCVWKKMLHKICFELKDVLINRKFYSIKNEQPRNWTFFFWISFDAISYIRCWNFCVSMNGYSSLMW